MGSFVVGYLTEKVKYDLFLSGENYFKHDATTTWVVVFRNKVCGFEQKNDSYNNKF